MLKLPSSKCSRIHDNLKNLMRLNGDEGGSQNRIFGLEVTPSALHSLCDKSFSRTKCPFRFVKITSRIQPVSDIMLLSWCAQENILHSTQIHSEDVDRASLLLGLDPSSQLLLRHRRVNAPGVLPDSFAYTARCSSVNPNPIELSFSAALR